MFTAGNKKLSSVNSGLAAVAGLPRMVCAKVRFSEVFVSFSQVYYI